MQQALAVRAPVCARVQRATRRVSASAATENGAGAATAVKVGRGALQRPHQPFAQWGARL